MPRPRRATVADLRELAGSMPGVTIERGPKGNDVYQVSRRSFVFFRTPRPDACDPETGERYDDVVVLWVADEGEKQSLVADDSTPFFTTSHFDGHPSVLLRSSATTSSPRSCTTRGSPERRRRPRGSGSTSTASGELTLDPTAAGGRLRLPLRSRFVG